MVSGKCFKFLSHIISRKLAIAIIVLFVSFIGSFGIFIFQAGAGTGAPQILNYQGRLLDSSGNLIGTSTGTDYCFRFSFYTDATVGGTPETKLWPTDTPSNMTVNVKDGIFSVLSKLVSRILFLNNHLSSLNITIKLKLPTKFGIAPR